MAPPPSGNGYISTDTLKEILRELDNKLSDSDLDGIIEEVDEDGSGTLDFDGEKIKWPSLTPPDLRVYVPSTFHPFPAYRTEFMEMMAG